MKQKIIVTSMAVLTACIVLGLIFSRHVLPVSADDGVTIFDVSSDYLTPQQFKAVGDGEHDDTEAFRQMFAAAYKEHSKLPSPPTQWFRCKPIYIPCGTYKITGSIVDESLMTGDEKVRYAKFEVFGAGRESTKIKLIGKNKVLFNNQISTTTDTKVVFGFSTFRDIGFEGDDDQTNTFMTMAASNLNSDGISTDGVQRLQFLNCGFYHFNKILECRDDATQMLSEITFSYCKISDCGTTGNACKLFTLTDPQAVNWRFDYTDIESINGDIFYFKGATAVTLNGGSVIIHSGNVFNFEFGLNETTHGPGYGNSPQVLCDGTRFEIWNSSSLIKTTSKHKGYPKATFRSCVLNATYYDMKQGHKPTSNLFVIEGGIDALFDDCVACHEMRISGTMNNLSKDLQPTLTFRDCTDINVDNLVAGSSYKGLYDENHYMDTNNVRIIVDDSYDFYLYNNSFVHTVSGLNECRQRVKLGSGYNSFDLESGTTVVAKPYGFVKYVELTVPKQNISGDVTLSLYETANGAHKKIGEDIKLTFESNHTHVIVVNDYVEQLQAEFSCSFNKKPASMNMTIVKY